ncbi:MULTISPECIES: hypothetical protein [Mannheimia]|uniref:Uncharacterized protein n=1 Tax=Mannheimia pernigra TaxID=111844 RepID=A0ABD7A7I3_9PAST|nr:MULTISPECIES: hypothetical protein [Mannheimia]AJE08295.2 hypothetical protein B824_15000 [Mannheimia haemolytica USDA-ARS-USMARC-184]KYL05945.1 hypothetical protein AC568_11725 [Mannheimia haemolytica]QLB42043.1 hypothetical protein HV560_04010 [Mannheimia pernigra]QLB45112.1 hypothetical protein HV561_10430 [Mannheimia pernigra]QTM00718.1 hypothetical protein GM698_03390 [Mannheimia sp. ZY171111]
MGTSQSSVGPNGRSPLLPAWVDGSQTQPQTPDPQRTKGLRQAIGRAVRGGGREEVRKALGHYARKASGGKHIAVQKSGKITQAGAGLFGIFSGSQQQQYLVNLHSLNGQPCDAVINQITELLAGHHGDSDKIRYAMNIALSEALEGMTTFDENSVTIEVIGKMMICYLTESIFLQIAHDAGKAWKKGDNPVQIAEVENALRQLIREVVDITLAPKFTDDICQLTTEQMQEIQNQAILEIWEEWEDY